ncbi:hypothetical protein LINPERHAP1_LOCUS10703 [Linum perenne]
MQAPEGEGSLPCDGFNHVFDLVKKGNKAFRDNSFEEQAIHLLASIYVNYNLEFQRWINLGLDCLVILRNTSLELSNSWILHLLILPIRRIFDVLALSATIRSGRTELEHLLT